MNTFFPPLNYVFIVVSCTIVLFVVLEFIRYKRHRTFLKKIPHRIHINGSRGKSSTTRLIGAVLRETGKTTITKTTGTAPRFILPDGKEIPIFRPGKPNIIEQLKVIRKAQALGAEILVTECMAITPEYIDILENKLIRSTLGVMTNVREDHLDVMGPTIYDAAVNMAKSFPTKGIAFTGEDKWYEVLREEAEKKGTQVTYIPEDEVTDTEMEGFSYLEHKSNVALALAVGRHFGVPRETAFSAMYRTLPDPGVLRETIISLQEGSLFFFNALAANDPDSSLFIWNMVCRRRKGHTVILMILRADRQQRTEGFAFALGKTLVADTYIIAGSPVSYVVNKMQKNGVPASSIIGLENPQASEVIAALMQVTKKDMLVTAMGNIIGLGDKVVLEIERMSQTRSQS